MKKLDFNQEVLEQKLCNIISILKDSLSQLRDIISNKQFESATTIFANENLLNKYQSDFDMESYNYLKNFKINDFNLRSILSGVKIISDTERASSKIIEILSNLIESDREITNSEAYLEIIDNLLMMCNSVIESIKIKDTVSCFKTINIDGMIDDKKKEMLQTTTDSMQSGTTSITEGVYQNLTVTAFERIGDHIVNIAEYVVYMIEGKNLKNDGYSG